MHLMRFCEDYLANNLVGPWYCGGPAPERGLPSLNLRDEGVLMSFATRKRRITGREANRMQTSRASSDGRHRTGSARAVEVAGPQPFAVEVQRRDAVAIVQPRGELDLVTVETLRAALDGIESTERLVLDLRGLSFIDSTGLQLLVALHQRAQRDAIPADSRGARGSGRQQRFSCAGLTRRCRL